MFRKVIVSTLLLAAITAPVSLAAGTAGAQEYDGRGWHDDRDWGGPPPEWHRHHHHRDYGGLIAGGIAAGLVGGLIGSAIDNGGPRYYLPPPPQCWYQGQSVQGSYDDGYHTESVRVCR